MRKLIFLLLLLLIATPCFGESPRIFFTQEGFNEPVQGKNEFRNVWECFESGDCRLISTPAQQREARVYFIQEGFNEPVQQEARMSIAVVAGGVPAAPSGDSCTGGLLFSWHCENLDVTLGTPAGCSVGDTVALASSDAVISSAQWQDGSNSCSFPTSSDRFAFDVSGGDIAKTAAGTVILYIRINTFKAGNSIFGLVADANNLIRLDMTGTDELKVSHYVNPTSRTLTTLSANIGVDTWYKVTLKWSVAGVGGKYLHIDIDDGTYTLEGSDAIADFGTALAANDFQIGESQGGTPSVFFIDNIKVYDSWL